MALLAHIAVTGKKQGQFKGESTLDRRKDKWMPVLSFEMGVQSPHESAFGLASGKRQYKPLTIVKQWGAASPQGLSACATNEELSEVIVEFTKTNPNGEEYIFQTVTLSNAAIVDVDRFTRQPDGSLLVPAARSETLELESWSFVFRKIEVNDQDGHTSFVDDGSLA